MKLDNRFNHPLLDCWGDAVEGHRVQIRDKTGSLTIVKDAKILQVTKQMRPVEIQTRHGKFDSKNYIILSLTTNYDNSPDPDDLAEMLRFQNC